MSLETRLVNYTIHHARVANRDLYIGLSRIGECPRQNYFLYFTHGLGQRTESEMMKFYIGYASEDDVVLRLQALGEYHPGIHISMFDGMVQGHTDGSFDGRLVEIKSIPDEAYLPKDGKLPQRVWWQVQAYLRYTAFTEAYVIYLARDTGRLRVYEVGEDKEMGRRINNRVHALIRAIDNRVPPPCGCGKCGRSHD